MTVRFAGLHYSQPDAVAALIDTAISDESNVAGLTTDDLDAIAEYFERERSATARHRAGIRRHNIRTTTFRHPRIAGASL